MRMKKIFLVLAAALCVATVSAQNKFEQGVDKLVKTAAAQKWSVGLRVGAGAQVDAECFYAADKYLEGRLGLNFIQGLNVDLTLLYQWNVAQMDWTPYAGTWFVDLGLGAQGALYLKENGGVYAGAVGDAKFGIKFNKVPIKLAIDWTPAFGPEILYGGGVSISEFYKHGLANFGISCVYNF